MKTEKLIRLASFAVVCFVILSVGGVYAQTNMERFRNIQVSGNATIIQTLDVDGTANLDDMDIDLSAEFEIDGGLVDIGGGTGGTADGDNDLLVAGDAEVDDTLDVDGDIDLDGDGFDVDITAGFSIDGDAASNVNVAGAGVDLTLESEAGRLILKGDEAVANGITIDANDAVTTGLDIDVGSVSGVTIDGGLVDIGGGSGATADGDNDLLVAGDVEVDGTLDADGVINQAVNLENLGMLPSVATQAFTYTAAAGGTVTLFTIADGEIWLVHDIYINVTTNFDATGDDATIDVGDGNDVDGLCNLDDAELQTTDVEVTGSAAGWQCFGSTDVIGAYITSGRGFIYAPSGAAETIDAVIDETSGETISAGAATAYIVYTRIQ
jgi:hypothetical protein